MMPRDAESNKLLEVIKPPPKTPRVPETTEALDLLPET
jgi:hypothetical protein